LAASGCRSRFGSLRRAYELIGFRSDTNFRHVETKRRLRRYHASLVLGIISSIEALGGTVVKDPATKILSVNGEFTVATVIARHRLTSGGSSLWIIGRKAGLQPNITVAVRMDYANQSALDYYFLPRIDFCQPSIRLAEKNGAILDSYRFDTLDYLFYMAERANLRKVAR
jgi:hypothetical protein